jgi:putative transposase
MQVITAKLKLSLSPEQKALVAKTALAYRDALNYASQVAFDNGKTSNGAALQKATYYELKAKFGLGAQMACNVPRQVSATYICGQRLSKMQRRLRLAGQRSNIKG